MRFNESFRYNQIRFLNDCIESQAAAGRQHTKIRHLVVCPCIMNNKMLFINQLFSKFLFHLLPGRSPMQAGRNQNRNFRFGIPFAYFFKQQRKRDPARNRARMVARDQQNPLSRLGQCRKTSGINRRRNCSANNFRLFARFRHRFRHQNAGQTMILNMENLPASSVGNLYTPQNLPPLSGKNPALQTAFRHFLCPKRKGLHCRISFMLVPHRLKVRSNH